MANDQARFSAVSSALNALAHVAARDAQTDAHVASQLKALTETLVAAMEPGPGSTGTLSHADVAALRAAAEKGGEPVVAAFSALLNRALRGTIEVDGRRVPLLIVDDAARGPLASFAGLSELTGQGVRGGLRAEALTDAEQGGASRTATLLQLEGLRMKGRQGTARGARRGQKGEPSSTERVHARLADLQRQAQSDAPGSVLQETLHALAPEIGVTVSTIGRELWKNPTVRGALGRIAKDPTTAKRLLPELCEQAGQTLSSVLGCRLVNEEVVRGGLQLMPSLGRKLGIQGVEACAERIGKVLLKEGAEAAVKAGGKTGVRRGLVGLASSIPFANAIPMLFTGAEVLTQFAQRPPDKRVIGKGLATFALQAGAVAFPPLGLAAAAVDMSGSVALAVADAKDEGKSVAQTRRAAARAVEGVKDKTGEMAEAIESGAGVTSQALRAVERSFKQLGSHRRAERAGALAQRAHDLDPENARASRQLHGEIGRFAFDALLPEMMDRVKTLGERANDAGDRESWALMLDGLGGVTASVLGIRRDHGTGVTDPTKNVPKFKMLISGMLKTGIAACALANERRFAAAAAAGDREAA